MDRTATVQIITTDGDWIAKHSAGQVEERVMLPGCTITGRFTFRGLEWVNYRLPADVKAPRDWDKGVQNALAAPAHWVGSLVLVLDAPEILATLAARDIAQTVRDKSQRTYEEKHRRADRFTRRYREAAEEYAHRLDLARADVERAVRAANPGAPEALIVETARNL